MLRRLNTNLVVMLVSDLRHYFDVPDDSPASLRKLADQQFAIVRAATACPVGSAATTAVGCTRRPERRPCAGFVMVFRHTNGEISWNCDGCGDDGVIHGWEGSPADLSGLDGSYATGDVVALSISRDVYDALRDVLVLEDAAELLIASAEGMADGVLLTGRTGAFEELIDYVVSEANAETNRRRQGQLDEACAAFEAAMDWP